MSKPLLIYVDCAPLVHQPPLHYLLQHTGLTTSDAAQAYRAAGIAKVIRSEPARWNTVDGKPPSQEYVDALQHPTPAPDGTWPLQPTIVTPYEFQVLRSLRGSVPTPVVVGYHDGGHTDRDSIGGCETTAEHLQNSPPIEGQTYLVLFGRELTSEGLGDKPLDEPTIADMYPYDPATDTVTGFGTSTKLADALRGLPPG